MDTGFPESFIIRKVRFWLFAVLDHASIYYLFLSFLRYSVKCESCGTYMINSCNRCGIDQYHSTVEEFDNGFEHKEPGIWGISLTRRCGYEGEWKPNEFQDTAHSDHCPVHCTESFRRKYSRTEEN